MAISFAKNYEIISFSSSSVSVEPNKYYKASTTLSSLTITFANPSETNIKNEYFIEFSCGSTATTLSVPSSVKWANGNAPTIEANKTYQISIVNNLGVWGSF